MNLLSRVIAVAHGGIAAWLLAGSIIWFFLLTPYAIDAYQCKGKIGGGEVLGCLKPVATALRKDSNIATYATATVAAIIALQLSRRANDSQRSSDRRTAD